VGEDVFYLTYLALGAGEQTVGSLLGPESAVQDTCQQQQTAPQQERGEQ